MKIGYACLTIGVTDTKISGCTLKQAAPERLREVSDGNLSSLRNILSWNAAHDIRMFRISSDIIPLASHPDVSVPWQDWFGERLLDIGRFAVENGIRLSMHPGQYTVLNALEDRVRLAAVEDLRFHAGFLDALGVDATNKVILHVGGVYGDKKAAMDRFVQESGNLPPHVLKRLILENDDTRFPLEDVLAVAERTGLPVVFDNLHNQMEPSPAFAGLTDADLIRLCAKTWRPEDGHQKIHYSQLRPGASPGAHSATIDLEKFLAFVEPLGNEVPDVMLEVKDKNLSALKCTLGLAPKLKPARLEAEWARYKYSVLEKDAAAYLNIRRLLQDKEAVRRQEKGIVPRFYKFVDDAMAMPETAGAAVNALQHVWGYVKRDVTDAERKRWLVLLAGYQAGTVKLASVKNHLRKCAERQEQTYLLDSLYFIL